MPAKGAGGQAASVGLGWSCTNDLYLDIRPGTLGLYAFQDASGRYGFRDAAGRVVIAPRFLYAYEFFPEGIAGAVDDAGYLFIDRVGRQLARAFPYDNGPDYFAGGRARIVDHEKVGFIDRHGRIVVAPTFDFALPFCENRAAVCVGCRRQGEGEHPAVAGGRWGYVDANGRLVVPLKFDSAETFDGGTARVVEHGQPFLIDANGRVLGRSD